MHKIPNLYLNNLPNLNENEWVIHLLLQMSSSEYVKFNFCLNEFYYPYLYSETQSTNELYFMHPLYLYGLTIEFPCIKDTFLISVEVIVNDIWYTLL